MVRLLSVGLALAIVSSLSAEDADSSKVTFARLAPSKVRMMHRSQTPKTVSPFLVTHGLPHLSKTIKRLWDDPKLALTPAQKERLTAIRMQTIHAIQSLKPEIVRLQNQIVTKSREGKASDTLKGTVERLATLKAKATMVHLHCIEKTRGVLRPEQLHYIATQAKSANRKAGQPGIMIHYPKPFKGGEEKCGYGKCGRGK